MRVIVVVLAAVADAAAALVAVSHVAVVVALAYNTHFAFNKVETTQWRSNLHALAVAILAVCVVIKEQSQPTQTLSDFFARCRCGNHQMHSSSSCSRGNNKGSSSTNDSGATTTSMAPKARTFCILMSKRCMPRTPHGAAVALLRIGCLPPVCEHQCV